MNYDENVGSVDEVEDLYELMTEIRDKHGIKFDAIGTGAVHSNYQGNRVRIVCERLGVEPLNYLWKRDQAELLDDILASGIKAMIIKTGADDIEPSKYLGAILNEKRDDLLRLVIMVGKNPLIGFRDRFFH